MKDCNYNQKLVFFCKKKMLDLADFWQLLNAIFAKQKQKMSIFFRKFD